MCFNEMIDQQCIRTKSLDCKGLIRIVAWVLKLKCALPCLKSVLVFMLFTLSNIVYAYEYLPIVKCYDKEVYQADPQNWSVGCDTYGVIYFGNSAGLLRNIFGEWQLTKTLNNDIVRSLLVENDTIWCGGVMEYGYFVKTSPSDLVYHHLDKLNSGQAWAIQSSGKCIYFQTEGAVVEYNKHTQKKTVINGNPGFFGIQQWKDNVWALERTGDLGILVEGKFRVMRSFPQLVGAEVRKLFLHDDKLHILLFTGKVLTYDGVNLVSLPLANGVDGDALFAVHSYHNQQLMFGSVSNGLYQVKGDGSKILANVNSSNGLIDNTVLSIGEDINGNLWLGLDYGIAYVEMQNALRPIFDRGATYGIEDWNGNTYLGTNKGLFICSRYGGGNFTLVEGSEGQVWRLRVIDNELFVCHNKGLFKVNGNSLLPLFTSDGVMDVASFQSGNRWLLSTYSGLFLAKAEGGKMNLVENINIWGNPKIAYDPSTRSIWADSHWGTLIQLNLGSDLKVVKKEHTQMQSYFNGEDWFVFYDGEQLFSNNNNHFELINEAPFNSIKGANIVGLDFEANLDVVGYIQNGIPNMLVNLHDGNFYSYQKILSTLQQKLIKNDEFINVHNGELRVATSRGVVAFNPKSSIKVNSVLRSLISRMDVKEGGAIVAKFTYPFVGDPIDLESGRKDVNFYFGINKSNNDLLEFRYRLEPYNDNFSEWNSTITSKEYTRLRGGNYKFVLQSRLNGGEPMVSELSFKIERKWYETRWFYLPIIILFLLSIFLTVKIMDIVNRSKLVKEKRRIKQQEVENTLVIKNEQLLQYSEVISKKNEFLMEMKESLARMRSAESKQLENKIIDEVNNEKRTFFFYKLLSELHQDFINRLVEKHPTLSPNDIRTLSFIRIHLGTKEIAGLMNISPKSVDISRYRLRKKLELSHDVDLNQYIRDL